MPALKLRRIDLSANNAAAQIIKLRDQFRTDAEVVSAASKKLTQAVFGEALPPAQAVERICNDVRDKGLAAVLHYTEQFDKVKLKPDQLRVKPAELADGPRRRRPGLPRCHPAGPVQRDAVPVRAAAPRRRAARLGQARAAPALPAAASASACTAPAGPRRTRPRC